jgi:hypothetical protein
VQYSQNIYSTANPSCVGCDEYIADLHAASRGTSSPGILAAPYQLIVSLQGINDIKTSSECVCCGTDPGTGRVAPLAVSHFCPSAPWTRINRPMMGRKSETNTLTWRQVWDRTSLSSLGTRTAKHLPPIAETLHFQLTYHPLCSEYL